MAFRVMQDIWDEIYGTNDDANRDVNDDISFYDGAEGEDESDIDEDILTNVNVDEDNDDNDVDLDLPGPQ